MIYGLFNKTNKSFIGFLANIDNLNPELFLIKRFTLDDNDFNLARYTWEGDYDNGKIVDLNLGKPQITEYLTETKNAERFWREVDKTVLIFDILTFIETGQIADTLKEVIKRKNKILEMIAKEKNFFQNSPNHAYRTKEEVIAETKHAFEV